METEINLIQGKKYKFSVDFSFEENWKEKIHQEVERLEEDNPEKDEDEIYQEVIQNECDIMLENYSQTIDSMTIGDEFPSEVVEDLTIQLSEETIELIEKGEYEGRAEIEYIFTIPEDATKEDIEKLKDFVSFCSCCIVTELGGKNDN